jgi:ABC-type dipeptide/oligopeptide/nickel transport system permease subunit
VLSTKEEDYVQGARALGAGDTRVMGRHILPNIVSALLVQATVQIPTAIIAEDGRLPGPAIFVLALSFNLAGDGLRDVLDPRDY